MSFQKNSLGTNTIIGTQTISTKIYNYGYYPLLKGDYAPVFNFNREAFISVQHYLDLQKPLVIGFYSGIATKAYSLNSLTTLQAEVQQGGGNLIIIANHNSRIFRKQVSQLSNLTIFFDEDNAIAEQFGLYDEVNPINNWLSGIDDTNASLPALYVIAPDRQVVFHHIDYNFNTFSKEALPKVVTEPLVDAVNELSISYSYLSVWHDKLVS